MKKRMNAAAFLSAAAVALSSVSLPATAAENTEKNVDQLLAEMSTEQKIEQMMMITLRPWSDRNEEAVSVTALNDEQKRFIEDHNFGGVCLFADNIQSTAQTVTLTNSIQQAALNSECGIPMLISADQEGGIIYRLSTGTPTCGNMALGATGDTRLAYENAAIIGSEIKALGINTDLAPVLDVNNNPSNPVINIRSFSSSASIVSENGTQYIKGLQKEGVITCCKHFPGHGDTGTDSHTGLPLINKSYEELKKQELLPFSIAVNSGTDMIMTAHIQFPQIEPETYTSISSGEEISLPATLSKTIITEILRNDYGFDGVVSTDSMVMDAIKNNFDNVSSATLAINADVDIILEPMMIQSNADIAKMEQYIADVADQVEKGNIPEETVDKSVTRILNMKKERGILDYTPADADEAQKIVGSVEHREKALQIAGKAITLIKNDNDILPLKLGENGKVTFFYPYANSENNVPFVLERLKKEGVIAEGVTADGIWHRNHNADEFEENIKNSDAVILAFEMYSTDNLDAANEGRGWQARFADDLIALAHKNGKKVIFISANIPYDIARFQEADAIIASYCANAMDELPVEGRESLAYGENYPAALMTIFGGNSPTGKLPVDIYAVNENAEYTDDILFPLGYGLSYKSEETTTTTLAVTTKTSLKTTTAAEKSSGKAASSPNTGRGLPSAALFVLSLCGATALLSRKKG